MADLLEYQFSVQPEQNENIQAGPFQPGPSGVDIALVISKSVWLDKPQVTIQLTVPTSLGAPTSSLAPTGRSTTLEVPIVPAGNAGPTQSTSRQYYTITEAAQILGMSERDVERWAAIGLIPARRANERWCISARWLDDYRPTSEAVNEMGIHATDAELVDEIRRGRRPWAWPSVERTRSV